MNDARGRVKVYWRQKHLLALLGIVISVAALALIYATGLSSALAALAFRLAPGYYGALFAYLLMLSLLLGVFFFPLELYGGFILEKRFGLSNQTFAAWLADEAKASLISFVFFAIMIEMLYALVRAFPHGWWIAASVFWIVISIVIAQIFPVCIIPLFYTYKRLAREDLRVKALGMAAKFGITVMDVFEIDFSAKTKKANAAIVGWGRSRRIILADNLVNDFPADEVEAVLAHEMAHYRLRHLAILLAAGAASIGLFFFSIHAIFASYPRLLSMYGAADFASFPALYLAFIVFSAAMMPLQNALSRRLERDADAMALAATKAREPFISLMERLAEKNLSDTDPSRVVELVFYNHPPIARRIAMARSVRL